MCGIFGYIDKKNSIDRVQVQQCIDAMSHRGPDGDGIWTNGDGLWLAHKRLSIIDLDERSAQPMHDTSAETVIVFNGEIYNYRELREELLQQGQEFKTASDTEVILKGYTTWGVDVVGRLKGMFAFALFDKRKQQIFLARDRMGEKPLFIYSSNGVVAFASELKAMFTLPSVEREVNPAALDHLLAYGYTSFQHCIIKDFSKLQPGYAAVYDIGRSELVSWQYWQPPAQASDLNDEQALTGLKDVLQKSVKRQLVADVPVGILLSGGVDSSLVTAIASSVSNRVNTYNVSFPNTAEDESAFAKQIASHFETSHTIIPAEAASVEWLPQLALQYDEPMTDQSLVPTYMLCKVVKQHCTVALGGDGADELFGGYNRYQRMISLQKRATTFPRLLRQGVSSAAAMLPPGFKGRHSLMEFGADFEKALPVDAPIFDRRWRKKLVTHQLPLSAEILADRETVAAADIAERAMRTDLRRYMPEDILVKSDRAAMLASLEVRAPFLDVDVVEFALKHLRTDQKVTTAARKIMLQKLAADLLPAKYDATRKQGFVPPIEQWLKQPKWQTFIRDTLLTSSNSWFNKRPIENLLRTQAAGGFNKRRIFSLLMIELWREQYNIQWSH